MELKSTSTASSSECYYLTPCLDCSHGVSCTYINERIVQMYNYADASSD